MRLRVAAICAVLLIAASATAQTAGGGTIVLQSIPVSGHVGFTNQNAAVLNELVNQQEGLYTYYVALSGQSADGTGSALSASSNSLTPSSYLGGDYSDLLAPVGDGSGATYTGFADARAVNGGGYVFATKTLNIPPGATSATFDIEDLVTVHQILTMDPTCTTPVGVTEIGISDGTSSGGGYSPQGQATSGDVLLTSGSDSPINSSATPIYVGTTYMDVDCPAGQSCASMTVRVVLGDDPTSNTITLEHTYTVPDFGDAMVQHCFPIPSLGLLGAIQTPLIYNGPNGPFEIVNDSASIEGIGPDGNTRQESQATNSDLNDRSTWELLPNLVPGPWELVSGARLGHGRAALDVSTTAWGPPSVNERPFNVPPLGDGTPADGQQIFDDGNGPISKYPFVMHPGWVSGNINLIDAYAAAHPGAFSSLSQLVFPTDSFEAVNYGYQAGDPLFMYAGTNIGFGNNSWGATKGMFAGAYSATTGSLQTTYALPVFTAYDEQEAYWHTVALNLAFGLLNKDYPDYAIGDMVEQSQRETPPNLPATQRYGSIVLEPYSADLGNLYYGPAPLYLGVGPLLNGTQDFNFCSNEVSITLTSATPFINPSIGLTGSLDVDSDGNGFSATGGFTGLPRSNWPQYTADALARRSTIGQVGFPLFNGTWTLTPSVTFVDDSGNWTGSDTYTSTTLTVGCGQRIVFVPGLSVSIDPHSGCESGATTTVTGTVNGGGASINHIWYSLDGATVTTDICSDATGGCPGDGTFSQTIPIAGSTSITIYATADGIDGTAQTTDSFNSCCTPSCGGAQCGDDGCGGSCGTCGAAASCVSQQCVSPNPCVSNAGGCSQICSDNNGSAVCSCNAGFTLAADGATCNQPPTVTVGAAQNLCAVSGSVYALSGSAIDPNNPALAISSLWTESDNPAVATIATPTSANTTFTAPAPSGAGETLNFSLNATNSAGLTGTASTQVTLWPAAAAPTLVLQGGSAVLGTPALAPIQNATLSVLSSQTVMLDASTSSAAPGTSFLWQQVTSNSSSALALSGASTATLSFQAPAAQVDDTSGPLSYQFMLTAATPANPNSPCPAPAPVTTVVTVIVDEPPVAKPAASQTTVCGGKPIVLDGSASTDPNGASINSYLWTQLPNSMLAAPIGPLTGETVSFNAPTIAAATTLTFALQVSDALGLQSINTDNIVSVFVKDQDEAPVANAGASQIVTQGSTVTLNGSGSYDPDGDPIVYSWKQIGGPGVCFNNPGQKTCGNSCSSSTTQAAPSFNAPQLSQCGSAKTQTLTFQLTVTDRPSASSACGGPLTSAASTVTVVIESPDHPPVASAGCAQTVNDGSQVQLDGSQSSDPDGDPLTYKWVQISGPTAALSSSTVARPTFTAPQISAGSIQPMVFQLTVTDPSGLSSSATVTISDKGLASPPNCSGAYASTGQLWPPGNQLINVSILGVKDASDPNAKISVTAIHQDEPTTGTCRGDTPIDGVINSDGSCFLRAERGDAYGNRTYYVDFKAVDRNGNSCTGQVTVGAPGSSGGHCDGRGALYDSQR